MRKYIDKYRGHIIAFSGVAMTGAIATGTFLTAKGIEIPGPIPTYMPELDQSVTVQVTQASPAKESTMSLIQGINERSGRIEKWRNQMSPVLSREIAVRQDFLGEVAKVQQETGISKEEASYLLAKERASVAADQLFLVSVSIVSAIAFIFCLYCFCAQLLGIYLFKVSGGTSAVSN